MTNIENYRFSKSTLALWGKKDVIKFGGKNREKKKRLWLPLVAHLIDIKIQYCGFTIIGLVKRTKNIYQVHWVKVKLKIC